jgi:hypothetical protein
MRSRFSEEAVSRKNGTRNIQEPPDIQPRRTATTYNQKNNAQVCECEDAKEERKKERKKERKRSRMIGF